MTPPEDAYLLCLACRRKILPGSTDTGTMYVTSGTSEPAALLADSDLPEEVPPIGHERRSFSYSAKFRDRICTEQLEALGRLEAENRWPGADLRTEADGIASDPELRGWLRESDRIADPKVMKGRPDLARRRRFGVLRFLDSEDTGFPVHQPLLLQRLPQEQGFWLLRLQDELEWVVMPVFKPTRSRPYARPTKDRLNHREARAILDWKASRLDMWLSDRPHLVGGRMAVDSSRGVLFDTDAFIRWIYALMN
jgi:hypothetical protein